MKNLERDEAFIILQDLRRRQKLSRDESRRERFKGNKVTKLETPCILFDGYLSAQGYGQIRRNGKSWLTHRWVWTEANGPIPRGKFVLHRCDNPPCMRVSHLYIGTQKDNMRDMREKGREALSSNRGDLEPEQILEIRRWCEAEIDIDVIAHKFEVDRDIIYGIRSRENFKYL